MQDAQELIEQATYKGSLTLDGLAAEGAALREKWRHASSKVLRKTKAVQVQLVRRQHELRCRLYICTVIQRLYRSCWSWSAPLRT